MNVKKTILTWIISLSSVFGASAAPAPTASERARPQQEMTESPALTAPTAEKRLNLNAKAQQDLKDAATKMAYTLTLAYELDLAKQITEMKDILYKKLPVPVWNKVVTALNNDTKRAKIIKSLTAVVYGVLSKDDKVSEKCKAAIKSWGEDPLKLAQFMGKSIGEDFVQAHKAQAPAPKK